MGKMISHILACLTIACFNLKDIQNAECEVACKRENFHGGFYQKIKNKEYCVCTNKFDYNKVTRKKPVQNRLEFNNQDSIQTYSEEE